MTCRFHRIALLITLVLLSSCSAPTPSTPHSDIPSLPPTPTAVPTQAPIPPSILSLSINDREINPEGSIYTIPRTVNPRDSLEIVFTIQDDNPGLVELLGRERNYSPLGDQPIQTTITLYSLPEDLLSNEIPFSIMSGEDTVSYSIRFNPGTRWSPFIAMGDGAFYAGERISLAIHDLNGDEVEVSAMEQVLGLGDRYSGDEYVTSQPLVELSESGGMIHLLAETPGNYRLRISMSDDFNEVTREIDVPIVWPPGENPFLIRGVAIAPYGPPEWVDLDYGIELIDLVHEMGANYVQLANWIYTESLSSDQFMACSDVTPSPCVTIPDNMLRDWIQHAHALGMGVLFKPHLIVGPFNYETGWHEAESWQIYPSDNDTWFSNYENLLIRYASLAQAEGVEIFCIGNELTQIQFMSARWRELIEHVREAYDGLLTYSDVLLWQKWSGLSMFWDDLDYIGIPFYFNGSLNNNHPTVDEMVQHIRTLQQTNLSYAMNNFDNLLIATEMGRPNFDTTNHDPWNWNTNVDNQEIIDWVEASFLTQLDLLPRFKGVFIWDLNLKAVCCDIDWDFREKPLFEALEFWFSN